jgi:hypothetical protein
MKRPLYAFLLLSFIGYSQAYGQQTSCAQNLRLARATYEQGRLHEVPTYVQSCIQNGSRQEKVEAYKLLCLTYIYLEEPEKADQAMLSILQTDHYYTVDPVSDPAEFVALYKTFRTDPIYRFGAKLGANATQPNVISYVPANDGKSEYSSGYGFQGGLALEVPLKKNIVFAPEVNFVLKNFKYSNTVSYLDEDVPADQEPQSREFKTTGTERHAWVSVPLLVQYRISKSKFHPYISAGVSTDLLISAKNTFLRTKQNASSLEEQTIDLKDSRNKINVSAVGAVGGKLRVTGGFAIAEVRYSYGITKVNGNEDIYTVFDKTFPTGGYVDGIFRLNSLSVSVGYVYNIFNPKKIRK